MTTGTSQRSVLKASEVCSIAGVKPFVLRSWQTEFPELGTREGRSRVYRQVDVDLVLEIKRLLFEEGLTLGAARREIENNGAPSTRDDAAAAAAPASDEPLAPEARALVRERIIDVKRGLEELLGLLSDDERPASATRPPRRAARGRPRPRTGAPAR
jgi:DNA-binding transcriptional MerR regulator